MTKATAYVATRTERVQNGEFDIRLVVGEPVPGLPDDVVASLLDSQLIQEDGAEPSDPFSQEARDAGGAA